MHYEYDDLYFLVTERSHRERNFFFKFFYKRKWEIARAAKAVTEVAAAEEALVVVGKVSEPAASKEPAGADVAKSVAVGMKLVESEVLAA